MQLLFGILIVNTDQKEKTCLFFKLHSSASLLPIAEYKKYDA
jgi:hypothetical protein